MMSTGIEVWEFQDAPVGYRHRVDRKDAELLIFAHRWFKNSDLSWIYRLSNDVKVLELGLGDRLFTVYR